MPKLTDTLHVRAVNGYEEDDWVDVEECQAFLVTKVNTDDTLNGARYRPQGAIFWDTDVPQGVDLYTWHAPADCTWGF